jgi:two-component system, chemotaxis family, chemotaxis protein CheY
VQRFVLALRVLVVDDAFGVRQLVSQLLRPAGFEVALAEDGAVALGILKADPGISLVVLDLNLPGISGLAVLQQIRSDSQTSHIPVVLLTAETAPSVVKRARELGATAWVVKPPAPGHLLQVVLNSLQSAKASGT